MKIGDRVQVRPDDGLLPSGEWATVRAVTSRGSENKAAAVCIEVEWDNPDAVKHRNAGVWWHVGRFILRGYESRSKASNDADGALTPADPSEAAESDSPDSQGGSRGEALANGERMREYGHPKWSFERIAAFWTAYIEGVAREQHDRWNIEHLPTLTGEDVGHMMNLLKISRTITDKGDDTLDDIEGYVACIRMLRDSE